MMRTENILKEIERREILIQIIDSIIRAKYQFSLNNKLKRGLIQDEILSFMGLRKNNMLCLLINERMNSHGYQTIINRGDQYYRNIIRQSSN